MRAFHWIKYGVAKVRSWIVSEDAEVSAENERMGLGMLKMGGNCYPFVGLLDVDMMVLIRAIES